MVVVVGEAGGGAKGEVYVHGSGILYEMTTHLTLSQRLRWESYPFLIL